MSGDVVQPLGTTHEDCSTEACICDIAAHEYESGDGFHSDATRERPVLCCFELTLPISSGTGWPLAMQNDS